METVNNLRDKLPVSRFSKITGIQRSYIYYNRKSTATHRKSRIPENIINKVLEISGKRVTYGHRRIWAVLRNEGVKINRSVESTNNKAERPKDLHPDNRKPVPEELCSFEKYDYEYIKR